MSQRPRIALGLAALLTAVGLAPPVTAQPALEAPAPNPPVLEGGPELAPSAQRVPRAPTQEWLLHHSADGQHPNGQEQEMLWLMNRARQDPAAEGLWLATSAEPDIALGRQFFGVDLDVLQDGFDALAPTPPAAFDRRLYEASREHSEYLISVDDQNHDGQIERVIDSGFEPNGGRLSVFAYADSPLNAHAALNIDWGSGPLSGPDGIQDQLGHRLAIMGTYANVGLALVPDPDPVPDVGPLVFSGAYMHAANAPDHFNRFLVGTVWQDLDDDGRYDPGEGMPGVTVIPDLGLYYAVTSAGGGYAIPITAPGSYQVEFSGGELPTQQHPVTFGSDSELLDVVPEPGQLLLLLTGAAVLAARARRVSKASGQTPS
jgi:hypothetical protein